jgi:hypothetical protein
VRPGEGDNKAFRITGHLPPPGREVSSVFVSARGTQRVRASVGFAAIEDGQAEEWNGYRSGCRKRVVGATVAMTGDMHSPQVYSIYVACRWEARPDDPKGFLDVPRCSTRRMRWGL